MKTTNTLRSYGLHLARCIALLSIGISGAASAQIGTVVYSAPLVVGNNTTIGKVSCVFDAVDKGTCTTNVSVANWCVNNVTASSVAAAQNKSRSNTDSDSGAIPASCATTVTSPFTISTLCSVPPLPYTLTILGTAYQKTPSCKKREQDSDRDKSSNETERSKSLASSNKPLGTQLKDEKNSSDDKDDCEDEKSSSHNDERTRLAMKNRNEGEKADDKENEGSSSGSHSPKAKPVPFQINGQLPCQVIYG